MQLALFGDETPEIDLGQKTRSYQSRIVDEAVSSILLGRSPLIEMATGTGKTRVAIEVIKRLKDMRVLWLAHRTELLSQATRSIYDLCPDESVGAELPDVHSGNERIVVASKDTIRQPGRLDRLSNFRGFGLVIIDEAHHAAARSYKAVLEAWPNALRLGLTATPDRFDKRRLGCFDTATTPYRIVDAIADAWLVPIKAKRVTVEAIDISGVKVVAGDLSQAELELVVSSERALHGCAKGLLEYAGGRPTICFVPGIDSARRLCEILHRYNPGSARYVTGDTDQDLRRSAFRDFGTAYRYLINVAVATEGTDLPAAACIALMRPTKSRGLFVQMLGRGTRPLPGLHGLLSEDRAKWIQGSGKPDCLVLDFVGNTGKHSVVTAADIAGYDQETARPVSKRLEAGELVDVFQALKEEEARTVEAKQARAKKEQKKAKDRERIIASVRLSVKDTELIGLGQPHKYLDGSDPVWLETLTPGQAEAIIKLGLPMPEPGKTYTKGQARTMILEERTRRGLATEKQLDFVRRHYDTSLMSLDTMTKSQAKTLFLKKKRTWQS